MWVNGWLYQISWWMLLASGKSLCFPFGRIWSDGAALVALCSRVERRWHYHALRRHFKWFKELLWSGFFSSSSSFLLVLVLWLLLGLGLWLVLCLDLRQTVILFVQLLVEAEQKSKVATRIARFYQLQLELKLYSSSVLTANCSSLRSCSTNYHSSRNSFHLKLFIFYWLKLIWNLKSIVIFSGYDE